MKEVTVCPAQMEAGIYDGKSKEAIDFCVEKCPYPDCILTLVKPNPTIKRRRDRQKLARELAAKGFKAGQISMVMRLCPRTIQRYLNEGY